MHGPYFISQGSKSPLHLPSNHCGWDMRLALVTNLNMTCFIQDACRLDLLPGSWQLPCFTQSTPLGKCKPSSCGQWLEGFTL